MGSVFDELAKAADAYTSYIGVECEAECEGTFAQWWVEHGGSKKHWGYHVEYWGMKNSCTLTSNQFLFKKGCLYGSEKLWAGARHIPYRVSIKGNEVTKEEIYGRHVSSTSYSPYRLFTVHYCKDLLEQDRTPNWMRVLANKCTEDGTHQRNLWYKEQLALAPYYGNEGIPYWMVLEIDTEVNPLDTAGRLTNRNRAAVQTAAFGCIPKGENCQKDGPFCCKVLEGFNDTECRENDEGNFTCREIEVCIMGINEQCEVDGPPCCGSNVCKQFMNFPLMLCQSPE